MKTEHYEIRIVRVPIERPRGSQIQRVNAYRQGQHDRRQDKPCASANGAYLDGWYNPHNEIPPYVSTAQAVAFNL